MIGVQIAFGLLDFQQGVRPVLPRRPAIFELARGKTSPCWIPALHTRRNPPKLRQHRRWKEPRLMRSVCRRTLGIEPDRGVEIGKGALRFLLDEPHASAKNKGCAVPGVFLIARLKYISGFIQGHDLFLHQPASCRLILRDDLDALIARPLDAKEKLFDGGNVQLASLWPCQVARGLVGSLAASRGERSQEPERSRGESSRGRRSARPVCLRQALPARSRRRPCPARHHGRKPAACCQEQTDPDRRDQQPDSIVLIRRRSRMGALLSRGSRRYRFVPC